MPQKNFEDQSSVLEPYFDFVIEEQCYQYNDCSDLQPYVDAHKGVFDVEYDGNCPSGTLVPGVNVMLKGPQPRHVATNRLLYPTRTVTP